MELWSALRTTGLTPTRLWLRLEPATRLDAATALYEHDWEGDPVTTEADAHIAQSLKFRPQAVRKLPKAERIKFLAKAVRPDRTLVSSLLLALHLEKRKDVMSTYLDALGIPHEQGLIDTDYEFPTFDAESVSKGVQALLAKHPEDQVDLYLVTLYMMDPKTWEGLIEAMRAYVKEDLAAAGEDA